MISICCSITVQYEAALLGELSFKAPGLNLLLQALIPSSRVIDSTLPVCLTSITSFAETNKPGSLYKWVLLISSGTFRNLHRIAASRKATRYFQAEAPSHLPLSILWRGGGGGITQLPVSIWHRRVSDLPPPRFLGRYRTCSQFQATLVCKTPRVSFQRTTRGRPFIIFYLNYTARESVTLQSFQWEVRLLCQNCSKLMKL